MPPLDRERLVKLEGEVERMRKDLDKNVVMVEDHDTKLSEIATDKARVVAGAWVANGLTCIFVAVIMWLGQRAVAAEAVVFRTKLIEEVRSVNTNGARK